MSLSKNTVLFVQILCFWTLSIVLSLSKHSPVYISKHNVSETGFCLRHHVKPTQLGPIDRASPYLRTSVPAPRWRYTSQAQHKPSARVKKTLNYEISIRMRSCTRELSRQKLSLDRRDTRYGTNTRKTNFPTQFTLDGVVVFYFCCHSGGPDGRNVQIGLTEQMVYQRHVGGFLVFPACGVWFNLQDLRFIPTYSVAFFVCRTMDNVQKHNICTNVPSSLTFKSYYYYEPHLKIIFILELL
jgi:hypothetical protein